GFAHALKRVERDVPEHGDRLRAYLLVGIIECDRGKRGGIHQLGDRRAAHARVLVLARDGADEIALLERQLGDVCEADRGVGMILASLRAESIEQCHELAPAWSPRARGQLVTAACTPARTSLS